MSNMEHPPHTQQQIFNKVLLDDFDYSDDEEEDMEKRLAEQRERMQQQKTRLEERKEFSLSHQQRWVELLCICQLKTLWGLRVTLDH